MAWTKVIVWTLCTLTVTAQAQITRRNDWGEGTSSRDSVKRDSSNSYFTIGADYASRVVFCGRDFGERQFGVSPYLYYQTARGLYFYTIHDFWRVTPRKPARNVLGAGYEIQISKILSAFTGYERWFNHYDDDYFDRAMQNEIEVGLNLNLKSFLFEPVFYYYFGLEKISQLDLTLARHRTLFKIAKKGRVLTRLEGTTTFATPVFAYIFYEFPDPNYDYEKFTLVDFEGATSLTLEWGGLEFRSTAHLNVPVRTGNEILHPFAYFTAEFSFSF